MDEQNKIRKDLILAVKKGKLETVKEILSLVDLTVSRLWTEEYFLLDMLYSLLHYAVKNKHTNVATLLFLYGSKVKRDEMWITQLQFAVMNGEIEFVNMLLNGGAQIDATDMFGATALHYAAEYKIIDSIKLLLSRGANVDAENKYGKTALHIASERGNTEIVEHLLNHGANINCAYNSTTIREGCTPLFLAVNKNKEEIIKLLLRRGANVNAKDKDGKTVLHLASEAGSIKIVEHLLNHGADINCTYTSNIGESCTPLRLAFKHYCEEVIKLLLSKGANVDAKNKHSEIVLLIASERGNIEIVEHLLNHGVDINCAYTSNFREGCTPLYVAVEKHREEVIKLLLRRGANVDAKNKDGKTALHIASEAGSIKIVEDLLNHGANINCGYTSTYKEGCTPLHLAVDTNKEEIVKLLLSRGANVDATYKYGTTALHIASEAGRIEIVEHLLNHGANINCGYTCRYREGYTPLHLAANKNKVEVMELLLRRGANVNSKDKDGETALHIASERGNIEIVEHLLNHGADINCAYTSSTFREGCTPLHLAVDKRKEEVITVLLNCGANMFINAKGKGGRTALQIAYDDECLYFIKVLEYHAIRIETACLYKSNKNISINSNDECDKVFRNECDEQIAIVKSEKFNNTNVSYYDILANGHNINLLAIYARNENIVQDLRSSDCEIKFPIYSGMIYGNFEKGERRRELLKQNNKIFHLFFNNFGLPPECTEKIFSYLSNADLRILIDTY